ncbi:nuclear transport factor 2 family protein [Prevotella sp. 10(H)]|uniref:nuclear transport factor 2 family protein n=1 Tax=Prevotella sp. 10(H) TaxID=1158294 RepID=UPI0004A721B9|nr:nuclear transport factor 2 family protein [Prevotella sp. 10(H)]
MKTYTDIALEYVEAINNANVDKLYSLMTDNHLFIDAHDNNVIGRNDMKQSWIDYFKMFPDYKIEVQDILEKDNLICLLGYASGTYKNLKNNENSNYWRIPAAWTAIIKDNQVSKWQVYADNIIVMDIINRVDKCI